MELISIHVPKTAGVSFRRLLQRVYGEREVALDYDDRVLDPTSAFRANPAAWAQGPRARYLDTLRTREPAARVVHGHFAVGKYAGEFPEARRIVWLREPIARLVSHYCYWLELPPTNNALHRRLVEERLSLEEFAALEPMRDVMSGTFLGGMDFAELDFVGLQENFDEDLHRLGRLLGWPKELIPARAEVENRTGHSETMLCSLDAGTVSRLRDLNPGDVALYQKAAQDRKMDAMDAMDNQAPE